MSGVQAPASLSQLGEAFHDELEEAAGQAASQAAGRAEAAERDEVVDGVRQLLVGLHRVEQPVRRLPRAQQRARGEEELVGRRLERRLGLVVIRQPGAQLLRSLNN